MNLPHDIHSTTRKIVLVMFPRLCVRRTSCVDSSHHDLVHSTLAGRARSHRRCTRDVGSPEWHGLQSTFAVSMIRFSVAQGSPPRYPESASWIRSSAPRSHHIKDPGDPLILSGSERCAIAPRRVASTGRQACFCEDPPAIFPDAVLMSHT